MTTLRVEPYSQYKQRLPAKGRQVIAQYDDQSIVVYQAYRPDIGCFAAKHGHFGGEFQFDRMSWIKPSFLWMMYRSGWGTKPGQEVVLAIWLRRDGFDEILAQAYPSHYNPEELTTEHVRHRRREELRQSSVRLQWDPDRSPAGGPLIRRAIQLGLRGDVLAKYAHQWIINIEDISTFVTVQRQHVAIAGDSPQERYEQLKVPAEDVYPVNDQATADRIGADTKP